MRANVVIHESLWERRGDIFGQNFSSNPSIKETQKIVKKLPKFAQMKGPVLVFWPQEITSDYFLNFKAPSFKCVVGRDNLFKESKLIENDDNTYLIEESITRSSVEELVREVFESWHVEYLKKASKNLENIINTFEDEFQKRPPKLLLDFFDNLYGKICENTSFAKIILFIQKSDIFENFDIDQPSYFNANDLYPITTQNGENLLVNVSIKEEFLNWEALCICCLLSILKNFEEKNQTLKLLRQQGQDLDMVFKDLPFPTIILDEHGDLVLYNQNFLDLELLPEDCKKLLKVEHFSVKSINFNVYKSQFSHKGSICDLVVLSPIFRGLDSDTEQLGIVASSLAHEINNPMTGILAALSYFEMSDEITTEELESIKELKSTVNRCQKIVETFLGFSRPNVKYSQKEFFEEALDRAKELIRFRMIESNIQMRFNKVHEGRGGVTANKSIMAIALYLCFCEIITAYSQHMLLSFKGDNNSNTVDLNWVEFDNKIEINLNPALVVLPAIENNLLISNLLKMEGFEISENKKLIIRRILS